jgi:hypothetical protein
MPPSAQQLPSVQAAPINDESKGDDSSAPQIHIGPIGHGLNYTVEDEDSSIRNIFCFGAFADKQTGILYNNLTGSFPYMSLEGNVCFLIVYHYESNAILALLIYGLDDNTILPHIKPDSNFWKAKATKLG